MVGRTLLEEIRIEAVTEVLELERRRQVDPQRFEYGLGGELPEYRAERVEVPVVVVEVGAWRMTSARRAARVHGRCFVRGRMVDAGSRLQKLLNGRLSLDIGQLAVIIDVELDHGLVQRDRAAVD